MRDRGIRCKEVTGPKLRLRQEIERLPAAFILFQRAVKTCRCNFPALLLQGNHAEIIPSAGMLGVELECRFIELFCVGEVPFSKTQIALGEIGSGVKGRVV